MDENIFFVNLVPPSSNTVFTLVPMLFLNFPINTYKRFLTKSSAFTILEYEKSGRFEPAF